jgi:hypothetical protein
MIDQEGSGSKLYKIRTHAAGGSQEPVTSGLKYDYDISIQPIPRLPSPMWVPITGPK